MLKLGSYWPWKTVPSHFHMRVRPMLLHRTALVSVRLFCINFGQLARIFWANGLPTPPPPPPGKKLPVRLYSQTCIKRPSIKRSPVKVQEIASLIYCKLDLRWMVTSIKRMRSPFLRSQSADFIVFTCIKRSLCLQKINSGSQVSQVTCFHKCLEINCLKSDVRLFLTVVSTLNIKLIFY